MATRTQRLTNYETRELIRRAHAGDERARHAACEGNLALVRHFAARYRGKHMHYEDLLQEGTLGLLRAIDRFDLSRKIQFSTYATTWILQGMQRALVNQDRSIRLPYHVWQKTRLTHPCEKPGNAREDYNDAGELDAIANWDDLYVVDERHDPEETLLRNLAQEEVEQLRELMARLPEQELQVLTGRLSGQSLQQLAEVLERSREGVRQIERRAMNRLRRWVAELDQVP